MADEKLEMTAFITAKPGKEAQLRVALREVVAKTVEEPGCILFKIFEDLENPGRFVLWEIFENREALRVHIEKDYTKAYFATGFMERTQVMKLKSF
ncbi:antibiotic biosynthesis monooxygenase [Pyxidicoccus parkwayensis]|uniref:Antibiotic biosynthesis monooxygenase n=1 Tax=Pyxidicoccus parkwayensis TaxID=2813578 RepID=A0ABX7NPS5_9BACT|nr:putative quinol monooxygenase [Pyxidicoccus parkwaysis]QSQ20847.1 antibiotic biosynthesis monooxygenase [Pyxidicoccus parkwaysis]